MSIETYQGITPTIGQKVYVHENATVIGDVTIGDDCSIWPMSVIRGDVNKISIGKATSIQDGSILHCTHDGPFTPGGRALIIGNYVTVGHQVALHACTIKDYCLIGIGSIILDDANIEPYTLIGAGSLIPPGKTLESGYLWLGNPAKKIRPLTDKEQEHIKYSAEHYVRLKNTHLGIYS